MPVTDAKTVPPAGSDGQTLAWRVVRMLLMAYLGRAARAVLMTRLLVTATGRPVRWLAPEIARFLGLMQRETKMLRPVARLDLLPNTGNRIMVELAIMTISAYRVLVRLGIDPANARSVVADIGWKVYASQLSLASLAFRASTRDPAKRLQRTIRLLLRFPFSAPGAPGYAVKSWVENGDIHTHFTHCPPQSFVRELIAQQGDRGELQAFSDSWCQYDWPGADIIAGDARRGHYSRARTLSAGDKVCDMCWKQQPV